MQGMQHQQYWKVGFTTFQRNEDKWAREAPFQKKRAAWSNKPFAYFLNLRASFVTLLEGYLRLLLKVYAVPRKVVASEGSSPFSSCIK